MFSFGQIGVKDFSSSSQQKEDSRKQPVGFVAKLRI
jgi:hypothetical protein